MEMMEKLVKLILNLIIKNKFKVKKRDERSFEDVDKSEMSSINSGNFFILIS